MVVLVEFVTALIPIAVTIFDALAAAYVVPFPYIRPVIAEVAKPP